MMTSDFILDVSEANFEYEVLGYSHNVPVVVDFWANWCRPCKVLGPQLEQLTVEASGAFRLARVDVDENPNLALRYSVRSIPTVKAFSEGQVVNEFVGLIPEPRLREFISKITPPSPLALAVEKAESLLTLQQWSGAEKTFLQVLEQSPGNPACLLGLAKSYLAQGKAREAKDILYDFPPSRQFSDSKKLEPLADVMLELKKGTLPTDTDLDAAFCNSIRLAGRGNIPAAVDGLLDILRQDRHYRNGNARLVILSLLDVLGDENPQTRQYRSELASILF